MNTVHPAFVNAALAALLAVLLGSPAQAQPQRDGREFDRERYRTPHVVYDNRFRHNHYYPAVGYAVPALPEGYINVNFRDLHFYYHAGVWYQASGREYLVVRPPVGVFVPVLPPAYATVWIAGKSYFYANEVYYLQTPGGFVVAQPPETAASTPESAPPPPPPVAQPGPALRGPSTGNWFYCESARAYYPYVTECREGWRSVPATPPDRR